MLNQRLLSSVWAIGAVMLQFAALHGAEPEPEMVRLPKTDNPAFLFELRPGWTATYQNGYSVALMPKDTSTWVMLSMMPGSDMQDVSLPEIAAQLFAASDDKPYSATEPGTIDGLPGTTFITTDKAPDGTAAKTRLLLVKVDPMHCASLTIIESSPLTATQAKELATFIAGVRITGQAAAAPMAKGRAAYLKREYDLAIARYTEAIRLDSNYAEAFLNRGMASQDQHNHARALADYGQALTLNPSLYGPHLMRGTIYLLQHDYGRAVADCSEAIRLNPESPAALVNRGMAYSGQHKFVQATADFNGALGLDPGSDVAYAGRGWACLSQGEFARGIADYEQATRLRPDKAAYFSLMALLRATASDEKIRDGVKAVELATKSCELSGWKEPAYVDTLAAACAEAGKFDEAVKWERQYLATKPAPELADAARVHLGLYQQGKPYHQPADTDALIAGVRFTEGDGAAAMARGRAAAGRRDFDLAIASYNDAIRLDPSDAYAFASRGTAYSRKGENDRALADFNQAVALNPGWAATHALRGEFRTKQGDFKNALIDFNEAVRLNPDFSAHHVGRGNVYVAQHDFVRGMADYNEAVRLDPTYAIAYTHRGRAYLLQNEFARGLADYEEALRLGPSYASYYNRLAWLRATAPDGKVRDGGKAVELATKACELSEWKEPSYVDTLAAAYAESGKFDEAVKWETKFLAGTHPKELADGAQARLKLYQQKQPYHEPRNSP